MRVSFDEQGHKVPHRASIELGVHLLNDVSDCLRRQVQVFVSESLDDLLDSGPFALLPLNHPVSVAPPSEGPQPSTWSRFVTPEAR